jgi:hypothetical protein
VRVGRRDFLAVAAVALVPAAVRAAGRPELKTLAGPFTQERTLGLFRSKIVSRGVVTLVRPDRLRWELLPPDEVVYWITPEGLAYKSREGRGRVPPNNARLAASLDDLRALLADVSRLRARYDVTETPREGGAVVEAVPKDGTKSVFTKLRLELGPDLVRPTRATLLEGPRDRTEIAFGDLVLNGPVDPKLLEPPA